MTKPCERISHLWRHIPFLLVFMSIAVMICGRIIYIQNYDERVQRGKTAAQYTRTIPITAPREDILDRHGDLLATSVPVAAVIADPHYFGLSESSYQPLADKLDMPVDAIRRKIDKRRDKRFVYIKRHIPFNVGEAIRDMKIKGISVQREYKRYYLIGEALATVAGLTDIDDRGIAGVEKSFNHIVRGKDGKKLVFTDLHGRIINDAGFVQVPHAGEPLLLSLDKGLQYKAHQVVKTAVIKTQARAGIAVVLDARSGEILAMVNNPSFNPNHRQSFLSGIHRNRAAVDAFEPGSTVKPFTMAALLEHELVSLRQSVDTSPGYDRLSNDGGDNYVIRDVRNFGVLSLPEVIIKSSNVGISRLVKKLEARQLWRVFSQLGFGQLPGIRFPGEAQGRLSHYQDWSQTRQATLSYGYGLSSSALQLAYAYTVFANDGRAVRPSLVKLHDSERLLERRVFRPEVVQSVRRMMRSVVSPQGTAPLARVSGYTVAGKTGTVRKSSSRGYEADRYLSIFAGMIPASNPQLIAVVVLDEPTAGDYYGGQVAAPVFAEIMAYAVRSLGISEDEPLVPIDEEPFYTFKNN